MASILSSKVRDDGKIVFQICADQEEALNLGGHVEKIRLFAEEANEGNIQISGRGNNEATKYFLIPKHTREGIKMDDFFKYQRLNVNDKKIFIFVID